MPQKPETVFRQNTVLPFLKQLPDTFFLAIQQQAISGSPDYLLCIRGKFVALELKSEKGLPSKLQRYILKRITDAGGLSLIAYPSTWPAVRARLDRLAHGDEL